MKMIFFTVLISLFFQNAKANEIEFIYLKNGEVIDTKYELLDIPLSEIRAIEIRNEIDPSSPIFMNINSLQSKSERFQTNAAMKMGGEGGGGGGGG